MNSLLAALGEELTLLRTRVRGPIGERVDRCRSLLSAVRFHLRNHDEAPHIVAILGGTGTGKSTLLNRLVGAEASATSYRRTFTAGPVAVVRRVEDLPDGWLDTAPTKAESFPVQGQAGLLMCVCLDHPLAEKIILVDTPDLDGDQLAHHAEADRVFRFAEAAIFLVTPEKYQMTESAAYHRLARRYEVPSLFVMNKCESAEVLDDFRKLLADRHGVAARVFALPRDDAAYEPPADVGLEALKTALELLGSSPRSRSENGTQQRVRDLIQRARDTVLEPLEAARKTIDRLSSSMSLLKTCPTDVDVSGISRQLQTRMQEQSILYLMGPQRVMQRLRQVPGFLGRLPRAAWDLLARGELPPWALLSPSPQSETSPAPDFAGILKDQFIVLQGRIDELLRADPISQRWMTDEADSYAAVRIDPATAAHIAEEELASLKAWLDQRWESAPRDTRIMQSLLKHLPGGRHAVKLSEAAPYLLALAVATHGAFFGPIDLLIIGGFSLATWLGEKFSNETAARVRQSNHMIRERFESLAGRQVRQIYEWLGTHVPSQRQIGAVSRLVEKIAAGVGQPATNAVRDREAT